VWSTPRPLEVGQDRVDRLLLEVPARPSRPLESEPLDERVEHELERARRRRRIAGADGRVQLVLLMSTRRHPTIFPANASISDAWGARSDLEGSINGSIPTAYWSSCALAVMFFAANRPSRRVASARVCPRALELLYPSRTRHVLSVSRLNNGGSARPPRPRQSPRLTYSASTPLTNSQIPKPSPRATWIHRLLALIYEPSQGSRRDDAPGTATASTSGIQATMSVITTMISAATPCCLNGRPLPAIRASAGM
jgi:hypothetical protein